MKIYKKKFDDGSSVFNGIYFRDLKNVKNEIYCNNDFVLTSYTGALSERERLLGKEIRLKKGERYKITKTTKTIYTTTQGYIYEEKIYVYITAHDNEKVHFTESLLIDSENDLTYGKHLLLENIRTIKLNQIKRRVQ